MNEKCTKTNNVLAPQILTTSDMPEATKKAIAGAFSKMKQRVIWKWESETMDEKPDNVYLKKWCPQQVSIIVFTNHKVCE